MDKTSREKIIAAANSLFAEKGFDATSIRDISEKAGVNVSAINYHFGSKNGLFETLLTEFAQSNVMMVIGMLGPAKTPEELRLRLHLFVSHFLKIATQHPEASQVVHKHLELFIEMAPEAFNATFLKMHEAMVGFFKAAQKSGLIKPALKIEILTNVFFGGILESVHNCPVAIRLGMPNIQDPKYRDAFANTLVEIFLSGAGVKS